MQPISYTLPVQITAVGEPKPFGNEGKFKYSCKTSENQWMTIFDLGIYESAKAHFASGEMVTVKFTEGKPNPRGGFYNPVCQGFEDAGSAPRPIPPQTPQNAPQEPKVVSMPLDTKREDIFRSVALKAAVDVVVNDDNVITNINAVVMVANDLLKWLMNEKTDDEKFDAIGEEVPF